jgi:antitoxin Phd
MARVWQLQEAKNKLSKVVDDALRDGPQVITRHGAKVAVILSYTEYRKIAASQPKLSAFFRESPLAAIEIDLSRDKSPIRKDAVL